MSLAQGLQQKQTQSLTMTPQLAQSIKLLQYGHAELLEFVRDEVEKNPLLELEASENQKNQQRADDVTGQPGSEEPGNTDGIVENVASVIATETVAAQEHLDTTFENVYDGDAADPARNKTRETPAQLSTSSGKGTASEEDFDILANLGETISLAQHLERQIALTFKDEQNRQIASYIAHALDDDGYFKEPVDEACKENRISEDRFRHVLKKFQNLEPAGIGATGLAECLAIQLQDRDRFDPAMQLLIGNLDLLAKREFKKLMQICKVDQEDLAGMIEEIRELNPRPADGFRSNVSEAVVPDVLVSLAHSGNWNIELNPATLPKVLVDHEYHLELTDALKGSDGETFVSECMDNANWLVRTLDQRNQTIMKVAAEIVKSQDRFFVEGRQYLKPMTLKQVADAIKMHESTVSRVTSNKFLHCEHGLFELKFFFTSAISANEGEDTVSSEAVKYRIKKLIDEEAASSILSDEQIVTQLQEAGIEIARRTVAKYREAMHISSSVQRRREKSSLL